MQDAAAITAALAQHRGSETFYRHGLLRGFVYTEGVRDLAERADCYWLIDLVASHQLSPAVRREEFQVWKLALDGKGGATATAEDGDGGKVAEQAIPFTDFPLPEIELFFENGTLYLPSER